MTGDQEFKVMADLEAEVRRLAGPDLCAQFKAEDDGPFLELGQDRMDYAVLSFQAKDAAATFIRRTRLSPLMLGGHVLHVEAGGWKAIVRFLAAQDVMPKHFVACPNPRACTGLIYTGLVPLRTSGSAAVALSCRRCDYAFCSGCGLGDHSPVPCKALLDWEGEGGSSIQTKEDLDTKKLMYEITKKCPKCQSPIEKNGKAGGSNRRAGTGACGSNGCAAGGACCCCCRRLPPHDVQDRGGRQRMVRETASLTPPT